MYGCQVLRRQVSKESLGDAQNNASALFKVLRTHHQRRTVPFAFYQFLENFSLPYHSASLPDATCMFQFKTLQINMLSLLIGVRKNTIHVAERGFVWGVSTPSVSLGTLGCVRFCNAERNRNAPFEEYIEQIRKRVEANAALQFICWLNVISLDAQVFRKMKRKQWNYTLVRQISVLAMHIVTRVSIILTGRFDEREVPL